MKGAKTNNIIIFHVSSRRAFILSVIFLLCNNIFGRIKRVTILVECSRSADLTVVGLGEKGANAKEQRRHSKRRRLETEDIGSSNMLQENSKINADHTAVLLGGAINEKPRLFGGKLKQKKVSDNISSKSHYSPDNNLAHLLHAIVGLDRYPQYLLRWTGNEEEDIDALERALEKQLEKVREQRLLLQREKSLMTRLLCNNEVSTLTKEYSSEKSSLILDSLQTPSTWDEVQQRILHPKASKAIFGSRMFDPKRKSEKIVTVHDVMRGAMVHLDPSLVYEWIDEEMSDIYSFPLLSQEFCQLLQAATQKISRVSEQQRNEEPQVLAGHRPINLDLIGCGWVNDLVFHLVLRPLTRLLFETELDFRHGYVAGYSANVTSKQAVSRDHLISHTDDSEMTMNVCLGDSFEGGRLRFNGLRGNQEVQNMVGEYQPKQGTAIIHAGRHLHEVTKVKSGDRYAYIMWARSWQVRSISCPCCWLNNRNQKNGSCICSPQWN